MLAFVYSNVITPGHGQTNITFWAVIPFPLELHKGPSPQPKVIPKLVDF
jgi:hypothetical protein